VLEKDRKRIEGFLEERKQDKLDKAKDNSERVKWENEFQLSHWLIDASKRAGQRSISTHPCTFSHPSARKNGGFDASSVLDDSDSNNDGYLRNANINSEKDSLGNAAALNVYKFLMLKMSDGKDILEHLAADSELVRELFSVEGVDYSDLRNGFLAIVKTNSRQVTSPLIKQIYFPIDSNQYHLMSVLSASGVVFKLKEKVDALLVRYQSELKKTHRDGQYGDSYTELLSHNIVVIGYGGANPRNISALNNKNGGKAYLLKSLPPVLKNYAIRFPRKNFFGETISLYDCSEVFGALHKLFSTDYNNIKIRDGRDYWLKELLDRIIEKMWQVREISGERYFEKKSKLPLYQKIWLCNSFQAHRLDDSWLDELRRDISIWIIRGYEKVIGKKAFKLDESLRLHILDIIRENEEAFR